MAREALFYIVDDNPVMLSLVKSVLEARGHEVIADSRSVDAAERITHARPDCVLLDVMMPGLDGFDLCRRLRASVALPDCKIVFLSGKSDEEDRARAFNCGADAYLIKPFKPESLLRQLEEIVESG